MGTTKAKSLREVRDRDVELCRTSSRRVCSMLMDELIEESIPFIGKWEKVPLYRILLGEKGKEVCVVTTHRTQYSKARRVIDGMDRVCRERIQLHIV